MLSYWLAKSEPDVYSIDDLREQKLCEWEGVRNYQARNYLKAMSVGDQVLFYHSSTKPPGVAGIAEVIKTAYPDPSQFDRKSEYFDVKSSEDSPRWFCPKMKFVKKFKEIISLDVLKTTKGLENMQVIKRGSRLSVQPVNKWEFEIILRLAK